MMILTRRALVSAAMGLIETKRKMKMVLQYPLPACGIAGGVREAPGPGYRTKVKTKSLAVGPVPALAKLKEQDLISTLLVLIEASAVL